MPGLVLFLTEAPPKSKTLCAPPPVPFKGVRGTGQEGLFRQEHSKPGPEGRRHTSRQLTGHRKALSDVIFRRPHDTSGVIHLQSDMSPP